MNKCNSCAKTFLFSFLTLLPQSDQCVCATLISNKRDSGIFLLPTPEHPHFFTHLLHTLKNRSNKRVEQRRGERTKNKRGERHFHGRRRPPPWPPLRPPSSRLLHQNQVVRSCCAVQVRRSHRHRSSFLCLQHHRRPRNRICL